MSLKPLDNWVLPDKSRNLLDRLVSIPSDTPNGVRNKIAYIKRLLTDEHDVQEFSAEGIPYLIVRKGNEQTAQFRILVPTHADTFRIEADWEEKHSLTGDSKGRLMAHGVQDEQASILNSIRLMRSVPENPSVCIYYAIFGDEEYRSYCARHLVDEWPIYKLIDLIISSEIGPLDIEEGDHRVRLILGRLGIAKSQIKIALMGHRGGHGARAETPSAADAALLLKNVFFPHPKFPPHPDLLAIRPPLAEHSFLGREILFLPDEHSESTGLGRPQDSVFNAKQMLVPPSSIESAIKAQQLSAKKLGELCGWTEESVKNLIECTVQNHPNGTSYPPFITPADHAYLRPIRSAIEAVSGAPAVDDKGVSNADENLLAMGVGMKGPVFGPENQKVTVSIPIIGGAPHSRREWADGRDIQRNYIIFRTLFTEFLRQFVDIKRKISD